jgi:streptogramin lyase
MYIVKYSILFSSLAFGALLLFSIDSAPAAAWQVQVFAGTGKPGDSGDGGPATKADLNQPFGLARGPDHCLYFCELGGNVVRKIDSHGTITTVAGSGRKGSGGDGGPALQAEFDWPHEIRFDQAGNLFIADMNNSRIRKVDMKSGLITSVAGTGVSGFSGDGGPATAAKLNQALGIQFDAKGDLYICDVGNNRVRKVDLKTGNITTVAGNGENGPTPDGANLKTVPLTTPRALDFDPQGNLWLATREGNQVFKLDLAAGIIHHAAGNGLAGPPGKDGPAKLATFKGIKGLKVSRDGQSVFLADSENHCIRRIDIVSGNVERVCGTGEQGDGTSGEAINCALNNPHGVFEEDGNLFISNSQANRILFLRKEKSH